MNFVLFAKMDQVFSFEDRTLKKILGKWQKVLEKSGKSQGKVREFCQFGKVGTLSTQEVTLRIIAQVSGVSVTLRGDFKNHCTDFRGESIALRADFKTQRWL